MIRIPPFIKPGDKIAIAAPSFGATTEPYATRLKAAVKKFRQRGYEVVVGECCLKNDGIGISTNPETAAKELENFYLSPEISAVFSCGGGELMCETVGFVDFEKIKAAPPKWFVGCSDNTNFIFPLATICGVASLYAQNAPGFAKPWEQSENDAFALLEGTSSKVKGYEMFQAPDAQTEDPLSPYIFTHKKILKVFLPDGGRLKEVPPEQKNLLEKSGVILGGCLDCLANLCGTPIDAVKKFNSENRKIIWVLESCDLNPMDIRRSLWQLKESGWFKNAECFVFGRPLASFNSELLGMNQYNAVTGILENLNVPVIMDADTGHIDPAIPLAIGSRALVKVSENNIEFDFGK